MRETVSFDEFVGARADALMRYAYVRTGDPHDAADLLQESLVRVRVSWSGIVNKSEITTESSFEKADTLYAYDMSSHRTRQITQIVTPPNAKLYASGFTVGSGTPPGGSAVRPEPRSGRRPSQAARHTGSAA